MQDLKTRVESHLKNLVMETNYSDCASMPIPLYEKTKDLIKELTTREEKLIMICKDLLNECEYHIASTHCPLGLGREIYRNAKNTLSELGIKTKGDSNE